MSKSLELDSDTDQETRLRIAVKPWEQFQEEAIEKARQFDAELERERASGNELEDHSDDDSPDSSPQIHTHYFQDITHLTRILTPKRLELLRAIMTDLPESIRDLARHLDRNPSDVHEDVHTLADYDIVALKTDGRAKRPVVPYDRITVEVELTKQGAAGDSTDD